MTKKMAMFAINATHMNVKSIVDAWKSSAAEAAGTGIEHHESHT